MSKIGCMKGALRASAALVALSLPATALAQDAGEDQGEIVVTAQRRAENIMDVPISITALSAETLAQTGVTDSRDLALVTPGLRIDSVGAYVQPAIRGVTTTLTSGPEANIATYLDGVYRPNIFGAIYDLPDVQQIEVLKGPQGTLFGRNATGGAILITTRRPDLHAMVGTVSAGYASFNTLTLSGFVSIPLVEDKMALSLSGYWENIADGWKTDLQTGRQEGARIKTGLIRGKLRVLPWDGADFTLTALYSSRIDGSAYKTSMWRGNHDSRGVSGVTFGVEPYTYANDWDSTHNTRGLDLSLRGDIELGRGTLTSTTAFSHTWADTLFDPDNARSGGGYASMNTDYRSVTQELIYASDKMGAFRAIGGLFFYDSESNTQPYFVQANGYQLWVRDKATSWAAFGEVTLDVTDRLSIIGGLRYSYERRTAEAANGGGQPPFVRPAMATLGEQSWNSVTPRVSMMYKVTPSTNVYATFSQGFKSGVYNTPGFQIVPVDPENIDAYEFGIKSEPAPGVRISAAVFHYNYRNLQVPSIELANNVLSQRILNAATAKITGAELNLDWQIVPEFKIVAGVSYLHAKYKSFKNASVNVPVAELPDNSPCTETVKPTSGLCNVIIDASGNRMIRSPEWSGSVTATYTRESDAGTFNLAGTVYFSSEVFYEFANRVRQPAYAKINASASWKWKNGPEVRVWGRNLTNRAVLTSLVGTSSYDSVDYERPREYGVTLKLDF